MKETRTGAVYLAGYHLGSRELGRPKAILEDREDALSTHIVRFF